METNISLFKQNFPFHIRREIFLFFENQLDNRNIESDAAILSSLPIALKKQVFLINDLISFFVLIFFFLFQGDI